MTNENLNKLMKIVNPDVKKEILPLRVAEFVGFLLNDLSVDIDEKSEQKQLIGEMFQLSLFKSLKKK